jgi:hypothetical protein
LQGKPRRRRGRTSDVVEGVSVQGDDKIPESKRLDEEEGEIDWQYSECAKT